jgi:hypothetical protein
MANLFDVTSTYYSEGVKFQELAMKVGRSASSGTWNSASSTVTYTYSNEDDLFTQLQVVLDDYLPTAVKWNNKIDKIGGTTGQILRVDNSATPTIVYSNDFTDHLASATPHQTYLLLTNGGTIESYTEKKLVNATATSTVTLDLSVQNVFELTLSGNTTIALSNVPASPKVCSITIVIHQDATSRSVTFPASFSPMGGNIPDITTASKTHIVYASTLDGGTRWYYSAALNFTT